VISEHLVAACSGWINQLGPCWIIKLDLKDLLGNPWTQFVGYYLLWLLMFYAY
jgi:hypothetical protein